ncbi:dihydrolipoyl dehydrogenase family protein [Candidatus Enterococcus ferrettii]|uniref:Glutathione reductase (NADPH) n=1 Tax=Candidatus Enterococcus ferrettii TaxID=2815324 RepID=A0ABV0ET69_9ENTE|nr:NAD(P)/FAD-dependent oxidoreductase [Enterococcus sp. 665A]MBO1340205.1 NAD(P)/FAD-dependent oxidoreductase [Enterococcus sp. 665A]
MQREFDVLVVGSGIAGLTIAKRLQEEHLSIAIVESFEWGGTTPNHGSTPKKYLLAAVEAKQAIQSHLGKGFDGVPQINWQQLMSYKNSQIANTSKVIQESLSEASITTIYGNARFKNEATITVDGVDYTGKKIILATGARPRELEFEGKEHVHYSSHFLNAESLPPSITIIGAGIIAFAITNIASEIGDQVHVLQHNQRALGAFDPELVGDLIDLLKQRGVQYHFDHNVEKIIQLRDDLYQLTTKEGLVFETNVVYSVAGRVPNVEDLGLEKADITFNEQGVAVNEFLQTTNPKVYAIGDCNDSPAPKLSNYAEFQANYLADVLSGETLKPIAYPIPSMSVFSNPKIAQTGIFVNEAIRQPEIYEIEEIDMKNWLNYHRGNEPIARSKIVIRKSDQQIVGITSISNEADLLVNYFTLLLKMKMTKQQLRDTILAYPSLASDFSKFY